MPNGRPHPEHYRCEVCGRRFLVDFSPAVMCAAHGEGEHCHTGEQELRGDGSTAYAVPFADCLPFATTEWVE